MLNDGARWVKSLRRWKGHMKALTFARKREYSNIENVQKKKDTDANIFAGLFVGSLQSTNQ